MIHKRPYIHEISKVIKVVAEVFYASRFQAQIVGFLYGHCEFTANMAGFLQN